jgi:hypothetical protein
VYILHYVYCQTAMQAYRYSGETWLLSLPTETQPTPLLLEFLTRILRPVIEYTMSGGGLGAACLLLAGLTPTYS